MVQLSIIFKENPSLIGAGVAMAGAFLHHKYGYAGWTTLAQKFTVTNALVSLSAMLGMVARTSGKNLDLTTRAISVVSVGAATMIPAIYFNAKSSIFTKEESRFISRSE